MKSWYYYVNPKIPIELPKNKIGNNYEISKKNLRLVYCEGLHFWAAPPWRHYDVINMGHILRDFCQNDTLKYGKDEDDNGGNNVPRTLKIYQSLSLLFSFFDIG